MSSKTTMHSKCGRPFALQLHYSLAAVAVALFGSLLGAVPVEGRDCEVGDVFKNGNDYTTASIPSDCTTLDLDTSSIGDSGATAIAAALKGNTALATLYLQSNNIGDSGATALAEALKVNAALTGLSLSTNDIGADGATAIAEALKANAALTALGLYDNKIGDSGATAIAEALKGNAALTYLDLSSNTIGDGGATAIAEALKVNSVLTELSLESNSMRGSGATALAAALKVNAALTRLYLYGDKIGDSGATALAEALKINAALTELSLESSSIGDSGATALAAALNVNSALKELNLYANEIGDSGATALAGALKGNAALTALYLNSNNIGDGGATVLAEALRVNAALATLDLYDNKIGDSGATAFAEALKVNAALTTLNLDSNGIDSRALTDAIAASVVENYNPITQAAKLTKVAEIKDPSLRVAREAPEKIARAAGVAALAAANPCGAHSGCDKVLGDFILAQFVELDLGLLHDFGVTSAMELLGFAVVHKEYTEEGGSVDPDFDLAVHWEVRAEEGAGPKLVHHALESFMKPLKLVKRKKLMKQLYKQVRTVDLKSSDGRAAFLSLFGLDNARFEASVVLPFSEWKATMHLPDAFVELLQSKGVHDAWDLAVAENNLFEWLNHPSAETFQALAAKLTLVEFAYVKIFVQIYDEADLQQILQAHLEKICATIDVAAAVQLPFTGWAAATDLPDACIARLEEIGLDELSDMQYVSADDIFTDEFVKKVPGGDVAKCKLMLGKTRSALEDAAKEDTKAYAEKLHKSIELPFNEWATAIDLPDACVARLEELGLEDDLSDFEFLSLAEIFTDDFVESLKTADLAKCRITIEKTHSALGYGEQGAEGSSHDSSDL